jgi:hypothetical protein
MALFDEWLIRGACYVCETRNACIRVNCEGNREPDCIDYLPARIFGDIENALPLDGTIGVALVQFNVPSRPRALNVSLDDTSGGRRERVAPEPEAHELLEFALVGAELRAWASLPTELDERVAFGSMRSVGYSKEQSQYRKR